MKKYWAFFKIRFLAGLQYRAAAWAGAMTQFAWGFMLILVLLAFYKSNPDKFPMSLQAAVSYIWLQQAFFALFAGWFFENDIFESINNGNICYDLGKPVDIYNMWYFRSVALRVSRMILRALPIFLVIFFLPEPYKMSLAVSPVNFLLFLLSMFLGLFVMVSITMLIYISAFYTLNSAGIRLFALSAMEILSGALLPLPFYPDKVRKIIELLPFASTQNTPFLIYSGEISQDKLYYYLSLQIIWLLLLIILGKLLLKKSLKRVVIQGG